MKHLSLFEKQGLISTWCDRRIGPGDEWMREIDQRLNSSQLILLLISPDFISSTYCYDTEMQRAMELHESGRAIVVPIILRPTDWAGSPFAKLQVLPSDGKPVTKWESADDAFVNVTNAIRTMLKGLGDVPAARANVRRRKPSQEQEHPHPSPEFKILPVLTLDIVLFSQRNTITQIKIIMELISILDRVLSRKKSKILWSPAGDGGSITFLGGQHEAIDAALSIAKCMKEHNQSVTDAEQQIEIKIGIHSGPVTIQKDFDGRKNVWGAGINISARVCSLARPNQILTSERYYKDADLHKYLESARAEITYMGELFAKHTEPLQLYNIYVDDIGIKAERFDLQFEPILQPLMYAKEVYLNMLNYQIEKKDAFDIPVIAKQILDIQLDVHNANERATNAISGISSTFARPATSLATDVPHNPVLSKLPADALLFFFRNAYFKTHEKNRIICKEGEPAKYLMIVVKGEIKLNIHGRDIPGFLFRRGDIIGEMGLFAKNESRTATLISKTCVIALAFDYACISKNPRDDEEVVGIKDNILSWLWEFNKDRIKMNTFLTSALFSLLTESEISNLINSALFLPSLHNTKLENKDVDLSKHWYIVIKGRMSFKVNDFTIVLEPKAHDCSGPAGIPGFGEYRYGDVALEDDTYLLSIPTEIVNAIMKINDRFQSSCWKYAKELRS